MTTPETDTALVRVMQLRDQAFASLRDHRAGIKRIADGGANDSENDAMLIQAVFALIDGDMDVAEYESETDADPAAENQP